MPSTSIKCSIALIATCISTLAALSIAHDLPGGGLGGKGGGLGGFGVGPGGQGGGLGDKGSGLDGFAVGPSGQGGWLGGQGAFGVGPGDQGGGLGGQGGGPCGIGVGPGGQAGGLSGQGGFGVGPGSQAGGLGGLGGLENGQCLASLNGVQGCIQEVLTSILTLQFRLIGPDCCQAILNIDDNCWPKVLPLSPIFPLKNYCTQIVSGFPQPAPPTA